MKVQSVLILFLVVCAATSIAAAADSSSKAGVVNINTADADQLQMLPRVGPALADRIIGYREANGPFKTVEEIVAVKGIGDRSLEKLEPYLVTSGATTLTEKISLPRAQKKGDAAGS